MENSPYHPNGVNGQQQQQQQQQQQASQYGQNPSGVSPQQLQQQHNNAPHTLPPLQQNQQHAMGGGMYPGSAPHTPRTPATPNTPGAGNFAQQQHQQQQQQQAMGNQPRAYPQQMVPMNSYPQQQYRTSASMLPHSSAAMSHPQAIAPAPAQNRNMPQPLRPMPPNGLHNGMQQSMQSPYGQNNNFMQSGMMDTNEPPTHVVGSQGRRGILPSAPGRPAVGPGSTKNALIPPKDADGKFPCPHCTKTYLHAKHLKRHLLRRKFFAISLSSVV